MGYYINRINNESLPSKGKFQKLIQSGGTEVTGENYLSHMICVIDNGPFEAAAYLFSEREYNDFASSSDRRSKRYLIHPDAKELSGYNR